MSSSVITVGLDVHKESISACWIECANGVDVEQEDRFANRESDIRRFFHRITSRGEVRSCYEAGPCGFVVYRQLTAMDVRCDVIAPGLIPKRPGDRIKTDRRDARMLARLHRGGYLTAIRVPEEAQEAVRDLLRCRDDLRGELSRLRNRLLKFCLRHGYVWRDGNNWTQKHWQWLRPIRFEQPAAQRTFHEYLDQLDHAMDRARDLDAEIGRIAKEDRFRDDVARLSCLRGINVLSAMVLLTEIGDIRRFDSPRALMAYVGLVPSLYASGDRANRGSITKCGNKHVRRILVESSWHYRHPVQPTKLLNARCEGQSPIVAREARDAQRRLGGRYRRLIARGKPSQVVVVAIARELCAFIWAIMTKDAPSATMRKTA